MATKLYVANLPVDCTEAELHGMFSLCGPVSELDIIKNYAFVHMATNEGAQKAVSMFGAHLAISLRYFVGLGAHES